MSLNLRGVRKSHLIAPLHAAPKLVPSATRKAKPGWAEKIHMHDDRRERWT